jgi:hypothetical protein
MSTEATTKQQEREGPVDVMASRAWQCIAARFAVTVSPTPGRMQAALMEVLRLNEMAIPRVDERIEVSIRIREPRKPRKPRSAP